MCGLVACWVEWVLTGDLSGTKTGAVGLTGHSEKKRHRVKRFKIHEENHTENYLKQLLQCN